VESPGFGIDFAFLKPTRLGTLHGPGGGNAKQHKQFLENSSCF
jgi:hypothetical protein